MKLKDPMQESCVVYSCMAQVQVKVWAVALYVQRTFLHDRGCGGGEEEEE